MKKLILLLFAIISIEFNLQWTGFEHEPNWVEVQDEQGIVQIQETREKIDNTYYWNVYDLDGNLITFLNFWTSY